MSSPVWERPFSHGLETWCEQKHRGTGPRGGRCISTCRPSCLQDNQPCRKRQDAPLWKNPRSPLPLFLVQQFSLVPAQDRHVRQLIALCPLLADRALDKERFVALPRQKGLLPNTVQPRMGSAVTGPQGFHHTVLGGCADLPARGRRFGVQSNAGSCRNAARKAWRASARRKWAGFVPAILPGSPPAGERPMFPWPSGALVLPGCGTAFSLLSKRRRNIPAGKPLCRKSVRCRIPGMSPPRWSNCPRIPTRRASAARPGFPPSRS